MSGRAQLGRRRLAGGWVIAGIGPAALAAPLAHSTDPATLAVESLAFLALTVLCALVGGLWPAVASALVSGGLLTWHFAPPRRELAIDRTADLVVLILFLVVAVSVSQMVSHAARRTAQAAAARQEADALMRLSRLRLDGDQTTASLLELVRETCDAESVSLLRPVALSTECLCAVGHDPPRLLGDADVSAPVGHGESPLVLALRGPQLAAPGRRVLESFASHLATALERHELTASVARTRQLEDGTRVRDALLAAVSHDLRTPLARTKAAVSSLRSTDVVWTPEEQHELLATIEDSTDRLHAIVADLLDLSRIRSDAVQPVLQDVGLEDVVSRALDHARSDTGPAVAIIVDEDAPLVTTDVGLLERVVDNLVDNARRHSPDGRAVRVVLRNEGGRAQVLVVDEGPGVADEDKEAMFGAFRRVGDAGPRNGLGLGLAVARGLVEAMGGSLTPQDTPGGGLTMLVDLPSAEPTQRPVSPPPQRPSARDAAQRLR